MTSTPASRSARATTFAPRSWPSRPALATMTRILPSVSVTPVRVTTRPDLVHAGNAVGSVGRDGDRAAGAAASVRGGRRRRGGGSRAGRGLPADDPGADDGGARGRGRGRGRGRRCGARRYQACGHGAGGHAD